MYRISSTFGMIRALSVLLVGLLLIGCGSSKSTKKKPAPAPTTRVKSVYVPPGVDSTTARQADSLAEDAFVSLEKQRKADARARVGDSLVRVSDSLWKYLEMGSDTTGADSLSQKVKNKAVRVYNRGAKSLQKYVKITRAAELDSAKLARMQADLLKKAQKAFEASLKINPYAQTVRSRLAQVYVLRGKRLRQEAAYEKAISIYRKLTRLRKDQPQLYVELANSHFQIENYRSAAENYRKAREAYLQSIELSLDSAQVDSAKVFAYLKAEADAYRRARDADQSLQAYRQAKSYATTPTREESMQGWIEWINWDDGHIAASFARDSLATLRSRGKVAAAVRGFETLKPELRTQSARNEIDWRLARAKYQLGAKQESLKKQKQAADRLQALVQRMELGPDGTPADSTNQRYLDTYGTVCLNLGRKLRSENLRTALKYLKQSAEVQWKRQALAELEVGRLLRNDVETAITYLEQAKKHEAGLNIKNRIRLYRTLVRMHSRLGNRKEALSYRKEYRALMQKRRARK